MAIQYNELSIEDIENILNSSEIKTFKERVRLELKLKKFNSNFVLEREYKRDDSGFIQNESNASTTIDYNNKNAKDITFRTKSISNTINNKFLKLAIDEKAIKCVANIFIKFIIAHEYVHVNQIQQGLINKNTYDESKDIQWKDRWYEVEANNKAKEIMNSENEFTNRIVSTIIKEGYVIDNSDAKEMLNLYNIQVIKNR